MPCNYSLLLHFNDSITATSPVDSSDTSIACQYNGNAKIRSVGPDNFARKSSCYFETSSDYVSVADNAAIQLDGEFIIDFWIKFDVGAVNATLFSPATASNNSLELELIQIGTSPAVSYLLLTSKDSLNTSIRYFEKDFVDDQWYHIAITRDNSNDVRLFLDGTLADGSATTGGTTSNTWSVNHPYTQSNGMNIGAVGGCIDEFRIVKGSSFVNEFDSSTSDPYCPVYGCTDPDAYNYNPIADLIGTIPCIDTTYWNKADIGVAFKANGLTTASGTSS